MIRDTWTMTHKEWMEILDQFMRFRRGGWSILLVVFFLGIFVPLQLGPGWANFPVMFFQNAIADGEAKARAVSTRLCRKEGIEDTREELRRNPRSRITKDHFNHCPGHTSGDRDRFLLGVL